MIAHDATRIIRINPYAAAFKIDPYAEATLRRSTINPHFVAARITRHYPNAAVVVDTSGEWPRVTLGTKALEIRYEITDLGGGAYRANETIRGAAERLLAAHGWDRSLSVKQRIAALVDPAIRMEGTRDRCVVPIKHGEKIEVAVSDDECTIVVGNDRRTLGVCKGILEAATMIGTLANPQLMY